MLKRKVFRVLLALVIFILLTTAWLHRPATNNAPARGLYPDHLVLSWTDDPSTTATITWRTQAGIDKSLVEYGPSPNGNSLPSDCKRAAGRASLIKTNLGEFSIHTVTITNLKPGTTYLYRVGDGIRWSRFYSFTTEDENATQHTAVVFGDSQCSLKNYAVWRKTLLTAWKRERPQFIINTGDLVDNGSDQRQWEAWFAAGEGVLEGLPEMPAIGNHESPRHDASRLPQLFLAQFSLPENGPPGLKELVYSFDCGPAHFVILDSQAIGDTYTLKLQQNWLREDLRRTKRKWKIVIFHRPPYYAKTNRPNDDVKAAFCHIIEENHVDLVVNGHDHAVMRTYPISNGKTVASSKGTVYMIAGRSGEKTYSDLARMRWAQYFYNPLDQPTYTVLRFTGEDLLIISKKADGTVLDSYLIKKSR
ncbi:MAG: purple acid phosphatase family protein [Thermacetogeniaceae bacterium]